MIAVVGPRNIARQPTVEKLSQTWKIPLHRVDPRAYLHHSHKGLTGARFVVVWNGDQAGASTYVRYFDAQGVPRVFIEQGVFTQRSTFWVDPGGFCGSSVLNGPLHWVEPADLRFLNDSRDQLRALQPPAAKPRDVLILGQVPRDTQVTHYTNIQSMQAFLKWAASLFPNDRVVIRPHPLDRSPYEVHAIEHVTLSREGTFLEALSKARLVVGLTSTCLHEAVVYGTPVLALGNGPYRTHNHRDHDRVAAGALALRIDRKTGDMARVLEYRFNLRPLGMGPIPRDLERPTTPPIIQSSQEDPTDAPGSLDDLAD